jgi:hypothetical protein
MLKGETTGVVVRPEVSSLRVMGSTPTQWTGLSIRNGHTSNPPPPPPAQAGALARASYNILSRYVGSRLCKPTVCARPGGHHRQMEAWSHVSRLMGYAYSHPIPIGWGSVMGLWSLPGLLYALKIIN